MDTRGRKLWHYRQVVTLATQAAERDPNAQQGALSIRGHALMRMAFLGEIWKLLEAVEDFQKSYDMRVAKGAPPASVGEALTDLGFARVFTGRVGSGLALMQVGVDLMRFDSSVNGKAFLARGLRKLEMAAKFTLSRSLMHKAREERIALAKDIQAMDQAERDVTPRWQNPPLERILSRNAESGLGAPEESLRVLWRNDLGARP